MHLCVDRFDYGEMFLTLDFSFLSQLIVKYGSPTGSKGYKAIAVCVCL